jgi:hypothetical protein
MKESNITNLLAKSKMSGFEVGRLMIQSYLFDLKQLYEGEKDIKDLLSPQEVQQVQNQLNDSHDIKIYNSCRRLYEYMVHASSIATITKKEIDIIAFKLYILISNEIEADAIRYRISSYSKNKEINISTEFVESILGLINIERDEEDDVLIIDLCNEFINHLKQWYVFQEVFSLISERMELPDVMLLVNENPADRIKLVNALIKDLQFLYPENRISKALFSNGIGHIYTDDEVLKDIEIIDIEQLKPSAERIELAKKAIRDLTYFSKNWGIHKILEEDAEEANGCAK